MTNPRRSKATSSKRSAEQPATQAGAEVRASTAAKVVEAALAAGVRPTDEVAVQRIEEHAAAEAAALSNVTDGAFEDGENGLDARASDNGIVGVEDRWSGTKYVGLAPARDKTLKMGPGEASRYVVTNLSALPYEAGYKVKDPKSGEFYATPLSGNMDNSPSRWLDVVNPETGTPLVGKATKEGRASRRKAAGLSEE